MTSTFPSQPPKLDNPLPHTPSADWAQATTSAIDESPKTSPFIPDGKYPVDPRPPGAFPRGADLSAPPTLDDTRAAADTLVQSVKQYIPSQEEVQRLVQNTGATVKQYLPEAVAGYLPAGGNASMPSSETHGNQGASSGGVGAFPGSISETSVAKLPDERAQQSDHITPQERGTDLPGATVVQRLGSVARQYLPEPVASYLPTAATATLPSKEALGNQGTSSDGVGALPGSISETSVAKLPDERAQDNKTTTTATSLPSQEVHGSPSDGAGALPGTISETSIAKLPAESVSLPSTETSGAQGASSGGVGALPGSISQTSIAKLPAERDAVAPAVDTGVSHQITVPSYTPAVLTTIPLSVGAGMPHQNGAAAQAPAVLTTTNTMPTPALAGAGMPHQDGAITRSPEALTTPTMPAPPPAESTPSPLTAERVAQLPSDEHLARGPDTADPAAGQLAALHAHDGSVSRLSTMAQRGSDAGSHTASTPATAPSSSTGAQNGSGHSHSAESGSDESAGKHHKPKLSDKLRGEVKVISGKLGGNEEKVEEGRRIKREGRD